MTASKSLPARPSLESLRKQAKKLARDSAAGDASAMEPLTSWWHLGQTQTCEHGDRERADRGVRLQQPNVTAESSSHRAS
jgi:hypothetical protein